MAWLEGLKARGFDAVVYLAPPAVSDAVRDEPLIVARQGLVFVNLPLAFDHPTRVDYATFAGIMRGLCGHRVLVHGQINLRASSMAFLCRAIDRREDPQRAYEAVTSVWAPEGAWKSFIVGELKRNGIAFDPYQPAPASCTRCTRARAPCDTSGFQATEGRAPWTRKPSISASASF